MTAAHNIDLPAVLAERLTACHPDVLREMLATFIHTLMGAEADTLCGAGYGQRSSERTNQRNGYRHREFVGIFPDRNALIRLVGAVLAEQHDEWAESRRYLGLDVLSKSRTVGETTTEQEATSAALTA